MKILEFGLMHIDKNVFLYFFFQIRNFIFFCIFFEFFKKKPGIFNTGLVSYNVNLQPIY
jgi:hypothetical protein